MDFSLKPPKPAIFYGTRDAAAVESWIYNIESYFKLHQLQHPNETHDDALYILFATTCFKSSATTWWQAMDRSHQAPTTWTGFVEAVRRQFLPLNAHEDARDRLDRCRQARSVAEYATLFHDICLLLPELTDNEKKHRFISGLKPDVRLEVKKSRPENLEVAVHMGLAIDSAIFSFHSGFTADNAPTGPAPMELGGLGYDVDGEVEAEVNDEVPLEVHNANTVLQRTYRGPTSRRPAVPQIPNQCFRCGSENHFAAACPHPPPGNQARFRAPASKVVNQQGKV